MSEHTFKCEFCGREFKASRDRRKPILCRHCIELRRLIRSWVKEGVWVKEAQEPSR